MQLKSPWNHVPVISLLTIVSCYTARLPPDKDIMDYQTRKSDSPSNSVFLNRNLTFPRSKSTYSPSLSSIHTRQLKKWQMGRVTRKQYEIINLLWRKTKIFVNVENTTPKLKLGNITKKIFDLIQGGNPINFSTRPPVLQSYITPSYIEFYYSDETDDHLEQKDCIKSKFHPKKDQKFKTNVISSPNSSFLIFHIKSPLWTRTTEKKINSPFNDPPRFFSEFTSKPPYKTVSENKVHVVSYELRTKEEPGNKTKLSNCKTCKTKSTATKNISDFTSRISENSHKTESTTVYDKIKFFEMYDKHTRVPIAKNANMLEFEYNENADEEIKINDVQKILLEHVDQSSHEHNEANHSKKHAVENNKNWSESFSNINEGKIKPTTAYKSSISTERQKNTSFLVTNRTLVKSDLTEYQNVYSYINKSVSWYDYPFAAVYINEPSRVHCEAASISAHWLVASGSCLSRLNQSPLLGEGRSAFVAYCGESWWQPERVSYVKYSVVHPWYHPRDPTRRHLYNIGVIQVVTSMMSACSEWAPVSLMSHQFAASKGGSEGLALGWGLDRYDTRYAAADLPKASLMIYKGLVFSDSCPGNIGYGRVKQFDDEGGVKNVFCLSLPPYSGEERDPIHGSLLLVGGKLIALYLQEERRPWGEQSAQYTGIWRLIPWVVEVAREPEEMEWKI